jgi:hypothetical protein
MVGKACFHWILYAAVAGTTAGLAPAEEPAKPPPPRPAERPSKPTPVLVFPRPGLKGKKVHLAEGRVSLRDALRLLADSTGLPVALEVEGGEPAGMEAANVELGAEAREAGEEEALLVVEALRYRAWRDSFPGGGKVIRVAAVPGSKVESSPPPTVPRPGRKSKVVYITEGSTRLVDFARLLSDLTGLPLVLDSSDPSLAGREILIAADIAEADEEVVKAILEVNRIRTYEETLPGGKVILRVETMTPAVPTPEDPRPIPIIIVPLSSTDPGARAARP